MAYILNQRQSDNQRTEMKNIPFMPTIFEHAAFLIGETPSTAARSSKLIKEAFIKAYQTYNPDVLTIGIDVYNIEAEALGCEVRYFNDNSIPGIITRPVSLESDPEDIKFTLNSGRIKSILDAAVAVKNEIHYDIPVSIGICGPFSILMETTGYDIAINAIIHEDERIKNLLEALLRFQINYCKVIIDLGLSVTVFESWATPPLVSPQIYKEYVFPYEKRLFTFLKENGAVRRPLVIGGNTNSIVDEIIQTGTTLLVSDFNTPLQLYVEKARSKELYIRANIDPKMIQYGLWDNIKQRINEIDKYAVDYSKIIYGTGVIPYDTPPENIIKLKKMLENDINITL